MNQFDTVIVEIFTDSPGGQIQLRQRNSALTAIGFRTTESVVTDSVIWANKLPNGASDSAPQTPGRVLMLTAVKP